MLADSRRPGSKSQLKTQHGFARMVVSWAREFCVLTGFHGYKYVGMSGQFYIERLFWAAIIVTAMIIAFYLVWTAWIDNLTRPILITVETSHFPIWNIPFPAITICDLNKIGLSAARRLSDTWCSHMLPKSCFAPTFAQYLRDDQFTPPNISSLERRLPNNTSPDQVLADLTLLSELVQSRAYVDVARLERLQHVLDFNGVGIQSVIQQLTAPCNVLLVHCRFKGRVRDCSTLFKMVRTSEGLCCSFNYFGEKSKVNGTHVPAVNSYKQEAARTSACGAEMGLSVFMRTRMDDYYVTLMASRGFKVLLHGSFDFPSDNVASWMLPVGNEMLLSLSPEVMYSTPRSTEYSVSKRGCLFQRELQLKHFKSYSYHNCLVECRYNRTLELCGCAPPLQPTSDHEKVCDLADVQCLRKYKDELETLSLGPDDEDSPPCDCQPECDSLHYDVDLSEGELSSQEAPVDKQFLGEVKDMTNYSLLHVFFVDLVGTRYRRDVYYTWRNLLASFGGLLGLLLGFSLTSGIEMVYFFTLRPLGQLLRTACHSPTPSQEDGFSKALSSSYHQHQVKRGRRMAWNCIKTSAIARKQVL